MVVLFPNYVLTVYIYSILLTNSTILLLFYTVNAIVELLLFVLIND